MKKFIGMVLLAIVAMILNVSVSYTADIAKATTKYDQTIPYMEKMISGMDSIYASKDEMGVMNGYLLALIDQTTFIEKLKEGGCNDNELLSFVENKHNKMLIIRMTEFAIASEILSKTECNSSQMMMMTNYINSKRDTRVITNSAVLKDKIDREEAAEFICKGTPYYKIYELCEDSSKLWFMVNAVTTKKILTEGSTQNSVTTKSSSTNSSAKKKSDLTPAEQVTPVSMRKVKYIK